MIVPAVLAGFLVGNILAVVLDPLYTGVPWGGPLLPCVGCGAPAPRVALLGLLAGQTNVFSTLTVAALAAGVVSILLLATRQARVGSSIPYGLYLVIGALWGMLAGGGPVG